jgi:hypothetical protein
MVPRRRVSTALGPRIDVDTTGSVDLDKVVAWIRGAQ